MTAISVVGDEVKQVELLHLLCVKLSVSLCVCVWKEEVWYTIVENIMNCKKKSSGSCAIK